MLPPRGEGDHAFSFNTTGTDMRPFLLLIPFVATLIVAPALRAGSSNSPVKRFPDMEIAADLILSFGS